MRAEHALHGRRFRLIAQRRSLPFYEWYATSPHQLASDEGTIDLLFGNPHDPPMPAYVEALRRHLEPEHSGWFAYMLDHPEAVADRSLPDLPLARVAHAFASEAVYRAAKDAAECFGAMGVMRDMPLQQYVHDALICLHSGAGNSDAKLRIAEALAGYRRPASAAALAAE